MGIETHVKARGPLDYHNSLVIVLVIDYIITSIARPVKSTDDTQARENDIRSFRNVHPGEVAGHNLRQLSSSSIAPLKKKKKKRKDREKNEQENRIERLSRVGSRANLLFSRSRSARAPKDAICVITHPRGVC